MASETSQEREMIIPPNEYAYVLDTTKGDIGMFVGPTKSTLSPSDRPVIFDERSKRFVSSDLATAIRVNTTAPEGWYVILKNPADQNAHPNGQGKVTPVRLQVGHKINIPGPVSFALWPGQMTKVLRGHQIQLNQYVLCRVYDENAARADWTRAVVKPATGEVVKPATGEVIKPGDSDSEGGSTVLKKEGELTMGQLLIIKGTEASFFIPPTGVEVIADDQGKLVRNAVTLERLEYCMLIDQNGKKRYVHGPNVVFPEPTEVFRETELSDGSKTRKFKAIELSEISGIHIKVIAAYTEGDREYQVGEELFITGNEQRIYFPREEHAIIKYDKRDLYYGIAIPEGEARYVLDRVNGNVRLVKGAAVFLPDPRKEVVARRILPHNLCILLYPGNEAALQHNASLAGVDLETYRQAGSAEAPVAVAAMADSFSESYMMEPQARGLAPMNALGDTLEARGMRGRASRSFGGDSLQRPAKYTEPRTVTLDSKFAGAVSIDIWPGYAVQLVRRSGDRRVVVGPQTVLLEYDESPQVLEFSTGKPKNTDHLYQTVYLCVAANMVTDIIHAETKDFCKVDVKISYRVNFEGDPDKWFNVANYVKFLCDHMRSRIRSGVQQYGIEAFYVHHVELLRDIILGAEGEEGERPGTRFKENGMCIYDAEILDLQLIDQQVQQVLVKSQRDIFTLNLGLAEERRKVEALLEKEVLSRRTAEARTDTRLAQIQLEKAVADSALESEIAQIEAEQRKESLSATNERALAEARLEITKLVLTSKAMEFSQDFDFAEKKQELALAKMKAEVQAVVDRATAVSPELSAALQSFADKALLERVAETMAPMAILGGGSVADVIGKLLEGTALAKALKPKAEDEGRGYR